MTFSQTHLNKRILFQSPLKPINSFQPELKPSPPAVTSLLSLSISASLTNEANSNTSNKSIENVVSSEEKVVDTIVAPARPNILNNHVDISLDERIDDEDFCSSDEDETEPEPAKGSSLFNISLGNMKFPFHTSAMSCSSSNMKKAKSSSILIDIEKDDKRKQLMKSTTESYDSEESDMFHSMCDTTKAHRNVDISDINYFLNQTEMPDKKVDLMSPITESTQRMPKSMQVSNISKLD